jgi:hypothetical protein
MLPDEEGSSSPPEKDVSELWQREIAERLRQIDSGEVDLTSWEEAEHRLWSKVGF